MKETITIKYDFFSGVSPECGVVGIAKDFKGIIAAGRTIDDVRLELLKLIRIKYEIDMNEQQKPKQ